VIDIRGAQDVDILGTIVAGGTIGDSGVIWSGPDSQVRLQAGQQLFIDAAVLAARSGPRRQEALRAATMMAWPS
jgi:hypothetical protein